MQHPSLPPLQRPPQKMRTAFRTIVVNTGFAAKWSAKFDDTWKTPRAWRVKASRFTNGWSPGISEISAMWPLCDAGRG